MSLLPYPLGPSSQAYRVAGGRVETLTLPEHPAAFTVPGPIHKEAHDGKLVRVSLSPGAEHEHYAMHALPLVVDIATRITPWATWYLAPGFFGCDGWTGTAWGDEEVAVCRTTVSPPHAAENALHEAWHLAEALIRPALWAELDARLDHGPAWPGDYYPKPCERRARTFAHFGMMMVEGGRLVVGGKHVPSEVALFWHVFDGAFGREVMSARKPPPERARLRRLVDAVWN